MNLLSLPPELLLKIITSSPNLSTYLALFDTSAYLRRLCRAAYPHGHGLQLLLRRERDCDPDLNILCEIQMFPGLGEEELGAITWGRWRRLKVEAYRALFRDEVERREPKGRRRRWRWWWDWA